MSVRQDCIISLLDDHGILPTYMDPHQIGSVTYYFAEKGGISLKFSNSCVPNQVAFAYLSYFSLQDQLSQIEVEDCYCNW